MNKNRILRRLKEELPYIEGEFFVKNIGLFGSYARGEDNKESDLDLLVEFIKPVGFFKFIDLENYLSEKLGIKVDLVTPDAIKPIIKNQILDEVVYA